MNKVFNFSVKYYDISNYPISYPALSEVTLKAKNYRTAKYKVTKRFKSERWFILDKVIRT